MLDTSDSVVGSPSGMSRYVCDSSLGIVLSPNRKLASFLYSIFNANFFSHLPLLAGFLDTSDLLCLGLRLYLKCIELYVFLYQTCAHYLDILSRYLIILVLSSKSELCRKKR